MAANDITPQSVYESLNAIRGNIRQRQIEEDQQQAAAEYARQQMLGQAKAAEQQAPVQQPQEQPQSEYLADQWLAQQKRVQDAKQYSYGKMAAANLNADQYKQIKEYVDSKYDPTGEFAKDFRSTKLYEGAAARAQEKDLSAQRNIVDLIHNSIKSTESIGSPEDSADEINRKKTNAIKTFLTSVVNSAKGSADAEQVSEFIRRSPELMNFAEFAWATNKSLLNPTNMLTYLSQREGKDAIEKFANSMKTDPDAYLEKVKRIHNDIASVYNQRINDQVVKQTSPKIAENDFGIKERPLLPIQERNPQNMLTPVGNIPQATQGNTLNAAPSGMSARKQAAMQLLSERMKQQSQPSQQTQQSQQDMTGKSAF